MSIPSESSHKRTETAEMKRQDVILEKILEANEIEYPQDLVDEEVRMMVLEYKHNLKYESLSYSVSYDLMQDDMPGLLDDYKKEAIKRVKTQLLLRRIIEKENFEVTKEELEEEAKAISVRQQMPIETVIDFLGANLESLKDDLLVRKAFDYLTSNPVMS